MEDADRASAPSFFAGKSDDGRRVPENNPRYLARRRPPRTMAQRAYLEDLKLWLSSSSVEEYEERESSRDEERRLEREAFMQAQPLFHKFPLLPPVLRLHVWKLALEEPTMGNTHDLEIRTLPPLWQGNTG